MLAVGTVSALLGVLYALMEHDLKRLLAYHSVENIGIIFIGIGAGLMFQSYGLVALATLGVVGGLYHTINHACFKALLFLGAGAVAARDGHPQHGGDGWPRQADAAHRALLPRRRRARSRRLPPLNGFASEWLVFQALLGGSAIPQPEVAVIMPIAVAMLALTSGLAAACFVKAFGITFLAIPRSPGSGARARGAAVHADRDGDPGGGVRRARTGRRSSSSPCSARASGGFRGVAARRDGLHPDPAAPGAGHLRADVDAPPRARARRCC